MQKVLDKGCHFGAVRRAAVGMFRRRREGEKSGGDKSETKTDVSSSVSSASKSEGPVDYSKYNSYLDLADEISSEIEPILAVYFSNVDFAPEFTVTGDYAAIKDAALKNLGNSPAEVMEALNHLASYMRFDDYEKDSMAKAPELHAELWAALQTYDAHYESFLGAIDTMASQGRDEDRARLLEDEQMILYHSLCMIHSSQDILDNIWDQLEAANAETGPEDPLVLPEIDMTNLSPLFADFQAAYDGLTEAMGNESELEKVSTFSGRVADGAVKLYTNKVDSLYVRMGKLAEAIMGGTDYAEAFDETSEAVSSMIDGYNSII